MNEIKPAEQARFKALTAGARTGKTYAAAREFLRRVYTDRKNKSGELKYWVVAPTLTLLEVALREVSTVLSGKMVDEPLVSGIVQSWERRARRITLKGGITITFRPWGDRDYVTGITPPDEILIHKPTHNSNSFRF